VNTKHITLRLAWTLAAATLLVGCSSLQPLSSTPPAPVITLTAPATVKGVFGSTLTFPAGDYKAIMEDKGGFYYEAPGKIIAKDLMASLYDGGLYVKKESEVPERFYLITHAGQPGTARFHTLPEYQLKR
jgi:hypothetical protein